MEVIGWGSIPFCWFPCAFFLVVQACSVQLLTVLQVTQINRLDYCEQQWGRRRLQESGLVIVTEWRRLWLRGHAIERA